MEEQWIAPSVSAHALNSYFARAAERGHEIHTLQIWRDDEMLVRIAQPPFSCTDRREVYSLSKTFTSTAVGAACDRGLLSPDDRVVDLFPDKLPETVPENLAAMRVSHVLSMNTGHASDVMGLMSHTDDPVRAFLAQPVEFAPGTHFVYNNGATCLLSAIVRRVTGQPLYDFLTRTVLAPIGIMGLVWNRTADALNEGCCGVQTTSDEIARLGRLYLHRGVWEGKRILSEEWIDAATSFHSDNSSNGTPDWKSGYGYQIWINAREGFRGDGAFGQLMVVLPARALVLAVQARVPSMQDEMDMLMELVTHLTDEGAGEALSVPGFPAPAAVPLPETDGYYIPEANPFGWTMVRLCAKADGLTLETSDGRRTETFRAGVGAYALSEVTERFRKPKLVPGMLACEPETIRTSACASYADGVYTVLSRHRSDPHTETIRLRVGDGRLEIEFAPANYFYPEARKLIAHAI